MKIIETKGITYLEKFDSCSEWYWGTDFASGDLYEAEEIFLSGKQFLPNRLIFIHYPDGTVFEPVISKQNQYFGNPAYVDGKVYILLVAFDEKMIRVYQCSEDMDEVAIEAEIPLNIVENCYNLNIGGSPLMLTRQGGDNHFQVIWPDQTDFYIGNRESFLYQKDSKLYFSEWHEDPLYREEINVREYKTGKVLEKIEGAEMTMPDGQSWILR